MSQLIQLRQRIASIKKTCKITRAMRVMAMSLYLKFEKQRASAARYRYYYEQMLKSLCSHGYDGKQSLFFSEDILDTHQLIVIIATTKGLCGSFNTNLKRYFIKNFFLASHQKASFIVVGERAKEFLEAHGPYSIVEEYDEISSNNVLTIAEGIIDHITKQTPYYSSVTFYSNYFRNFFIQIPQKTRLIPFSAKILGLSAEPQKEGAVAPEKIENKGLQDISLGPEEIVYEEEPLWEQDKADTMIYLGMHFIRSKILNILYDSLLAEQASRFLAMDQSTNNAEKYLEKLTLHYNKSRQGLITQEVSELSAGTSVRPPE